MKSVRLLDVKRIEPTDADLPREGKSKVLIKVELCGICGSDLHIWENGRPEGLIPGHELSGTVFNPGPTGGVLKAGDRVTAVPVNPCGTCSACMSMQFNRCLNLMADAPGITTPGAFAEYFAITAGSVRKMPDSMSFEEGAMVEPSAVALHAVNLAGIEPGDKVLIVGGGIIGLLSAAWARICGAAHIGLSEMNAKRGEKALALGDVDEVYDARDPKLQKKLLALTGGGFDKVIECAGPAPAVKSAIGATAHGAVVVLAGISYSDIPVSTMRIAMRELTLKGSYAYTLGEFDTTMDYIARKVLKTERFIDETIGLEGVQSAFTRLADPTGHVVKILVRPH